MLIDNRGKLFGRVNIIDLSALIVVAAMVFGFLWVRATNGVLQKIVRAAGPTDVTVAIRGARIVDPAFIKAGDKVFITIRNQPYAPVEVVKVQAARRQFTYADPQGKLKTGDDPTDPLAYDLLVTIRDNGQVTDDGVVLGGNKVKAGIPIELEGFKFRMTGTIVDLTVPKG
jgi:hypothetical protein